eukprot:110977-Rhodomonas_salina.1
MPMNSCIWSACAGWNTVLLFRRFASRDLEKDGHPRRMLPVAMSETRLALIRAACWAARGVDAVSPALSPL